MFSELARVPVRSAQLSLLAARRPRSGRPATMASSRPVLPRRAESTGSILCITSYYRAHLEFYSAPAGGRAALSGLSLSLSPVLSAPFLVR